MLAVTTSQDNQPTPQQVPEQGPEQGIEADDLNTPMIVVVGLISTVLLICSVLGVMAFFDHYLMLQQEVQVTQAIYSDSETAIAEQQNRLNGYKIVDEKAGRYSIPIDRAMEIVVKELNSQADE